MKLSVTTKIFLAFVAAIAIFGVALSYNLSNMATLRQNTALIRNGLLPASLEVSTLVRSAKNLEVLLQQPQRRLRLFSRDYLYAANPFLALKNALRRLRRRRALTQLHATHRRQIHLWLARLEKLTGKERQFQRWVDQYIGERDPASKKASAAIAAIVTDVRWFRLELRRIQRDLFQQLSRANEIADREERRSSLTTLIASVAALLAAILILLISQWTLRPLRVLRSSVKEIARGDFNQRLEIRTHDEIGQLAADVNSMTASLRQRDAELAARQLELQRAYDEVTTLQAFNENVIQSIPSALVVCDLDLTVQSANRPALDLLRASEGDLVGRPVAELAPFASIEQFVKQIRAVLAAEQPVCRFEAVPLAVAESEVKVDWRVEPFREEAAISGLLLIGEDVTEKLATEARLLQNERLAAVGKMMSQITHEIRNPLSSIGLNAELLEEELAALDGDKDEPIALLQAIQREIDRLTGVTEQYLRFGRPPKPDRLEVDVKRLVEGLLFFLREELQGHGVEVAVELETLPYISIDENQIKQALINLIRNALEAMPRGGRLAIGARRVGGGVELTVSDSGAGIDAESQKRIFEPFFSTKESGTGLGLALTKQIIEEHGGEISCDSELGKGTRFAIRFPLPERGKEVTEWYGS